jgi:ketosteroid isomerase-like protein
MQDKTNAILQAFGAYAKDFESLDPEKVAPYFHANATLMTAREVAFMSDQSAVKNVFQLLFDDLKGKGFKYSKMNSAHVKQLSDNQAVVSGSATRYRSDKTELETFGLTYTLREEKDTWKIIFGILHDVV